MLIIEIVEVEEKDVRRRNKEDVRKGKNKWVGDTVGG